MPDSLNVLETRICMRVLNVHGATLLVSPYDDYLAVRNLRSRGAIEIQDRPCSAMLVIAPEPRKTLSNQLFEA